MSRSTNFSLALADLVIRFRWVVLLATLVSTLLIASGARHLAFATSYRNFFSPDNPQLKAFDDLQATFSKTDNLLFVVQNPGGSIFEPETASAIEWLTEEAWLLPFNTRVDSIANFQHTWSQEDDLTVEKLIEDAATMSPEELDRRKAIALAEPLLAGRVLSHDADTTGVNVTLNFPMESLEETPQVASAARAVAAEFRQKYPDLTIGISGLAMLNNAFSESGKKDSMTLIPLMYAIILLIMTLILRSLGIELTPISLSATTIILTLAVADSIHILVTMRNLLRQGMEKRAAIRESVRINFIPVSVTSLTTIIGFLALNFSETPPFHDLGNLTAMGIATAWLLSITTLPALLAVLPWRIKTSQKEQQTKGFLPGYVSLLTRRPKLVLSLMSVVVFGSILFVPRVELNDEWVKYFDHRVDFRTDTEFMMEHLSGLYDLQFGVPANGPGGISEPEYLKHLEAFGAWLRAQPEIMHVYSYSDIVKRLNRNMHGDDPAKYTVPENRELAAQYLLLYEMSLPSGPSAMFAFVSERNINSMIKGNVIAILLISIIIMLTLQSWKIGVLSLIPNTVPILMTFGLWGLLVGQVGMAAATVTATSLGIVVDDTVHFLAKFLLARREKGASRQQAVRYAFDTVGPALLTTSIILAIGFSVLSYSTFKINSEMGMLTALTIGIALLFDFTVLPALLMLGRKETTETVAKI